MYTIHRYTLSATGTVPRAQPLIRTTGRIAHRPLKTSVALRPPHAIARQIHARRPGGGLEAKNSRKETHEAPDGAGKLSDSQSYREVIGRSKLYTAPLRPGKRSRTRTEDGPLAIRSLANPSRTFQHDDYTTGWICALPIEMAAARSMLDEVHADLPARRFDDNTYILGRMCYHNIVITCLPAGIYGAVTAAVVATRMLSTFQSIRFGLMVGIGGGVPNQADIRLGDVVVGKPTKDSPGAIQCDIGFECTRTLNKPPYVLLNALSKLQANHLVSGNRMPELLLMMLDRHPLMKSIVMPGDLDQLFCPECSHPGERGTCPHCDGHHLITRMPRKARSPQVHYGLIVSATQVVKDGKTRDRLAKRLGNLCFEMEAAGLMDNFPCLVIRGISDYADLHKNNQWQGYAAATAAAYARELLSVIPPAEVENERMISPPSLRW